MYICKGRALHLFFGQNTKLFVHLNLNLLPSIKTILSVDKLPTYRLRGKGRIFRRMNSNCDYR